MTGPGAGFVPVDDPESVPVRDAATVVVIRDVADTDSTPGGIEVFLIQRVQEMAFAGGMTVFPGGGVDARDAEADVAWTGPHPDWWADRFGADEATAQALVCAAVRETFEECGVLLAGRTPDTVLDDATPYHPARAQLVDKTISLAGFLREHDLILRSDLIVPLAHWITPLGERRRYDTRFFLAALPGGQEADDRTTEAASATWHRVDDILAEWEAGRVFLLPPTWAQLQELRRFDTVADALAAPREITMICPTVISDGSSVRLEFDGVERYNRR
ncbi:NUDIX hydrolase [Williamsia maris]|uniref:NUDIX domain-containing protein n=1 Tax=Williamsia maris TaxID=72806 RepID=A0ABT1HGD2_9NOCA|nr:NUDIX domain-containing protein [Williamsia maris]MCP2177249.1 NUDIX domain-containing protein [Williamsia maris]